MPFRREVETARAWGVPRSIFLGRPAPAPGEPLWLPEDRWWALALAEVEAGICRDCGHPLVESTAPENSGKYKAGLVRCFGCLAVSKKLATHQAGGGKTEGLQVHVTRST